MVIEVVEIRGTFATRNAKREGKTIAMFSCLKYLHRCCHPCTAGRTDWRYYSRVPCSKDLAEKQPGPMP